MTTKTATRRSSKPSRAKTEAVTVYTLDEAIDKAVQTFAPNDAVGSLGDAYCPMADLTAWIATLPRTQTALRRYVIGWGDITENATGKIASHFIPVGMIPSHVGVPPHGDVQVKREKIIFLLALESLGFLRSAPGWETMGRVRPVALDEDGIDFEDV